MSFDLTNKKAIKIQHITHAQMECFQRNIPPGWSISFFRPTLRPDILEMTITRKDKVGFKLSTTGGMLLDNPDKDFLDAIGAGVQRLLNANKKDVR